MEGTGKGNGMTGGSGTEDGQEEGHHHRHLVADGIDMAEKDGERELLQMAPMGHTCQCLQRWELAMHACSDSL